MQIEISTLNQFHFDNMTEDHTYSRYIDRLEKARFMAIETSRPYFNMIISIKRREQPTYLISENGISVIDDGLEDSDRKCIALCEETINSIHKKAIESISFYHNRI